MTKPTAPNVQIGEGRIHRARSDFLGHVVTLCGLTLTNPKTTDEWVNCRRCWKAGKG